MKATIYEVVKGIRQLIYQKDDEGVDINKVFLGPSDPIIQELYSFLANNYDLSDIHILCDSNYFDFWVYIYWDDVLLVEILRKTVNGRTVFTVNVATKLSLVASEAGVSSLVDYEGSVQDLVKLIKQHQNS